MGALADAVELINDVAIAIKQRSVDRIVTFLEDGV